MRLHHLEVTAFGPFAGTGGIDGGHGDGAGHADGSGIGRTFDAVKLRWE